MPNKIGFNNFKSFGPNMQYFSDKPITLVYGANSVGKSSLLHAQLYLKHNLLYNGLDLMQSQFAGDELSLNGFENVIYKHNVKDSINYEISVKDLEKIKSTLKNTKIDLEFLNNIASVTFKISLNKQNKFINTNIECIVNDETLFLITQNNLDIKIEKDNIILDFAIVKKDKDTTIEKFKVIYVFLIYLEENKKHQYIAPLREYPKRNDLKFSRRMTTQYKFSTIVSNATNKIKDPATGFNPKDKFKFSYKLILKHASISAKMKKLAIVMKFEQKLFGFLKYWESYYPYRNMISKNSVFRNGFLNSKRMWRDFYENKDIRDNVNKWLSNSDYNLHYRLETKSNSLIILDNLLNIQVHPRDIGLGVSQVLPILHAAYGSKETKIFIEQPELHLHPKLQSELADEFIKSMHDNKNEFMIETHSEYLLLRMMKRMRQTSEGTLPDEKLKLTPDDICLLYVDSDENSTFVLELELDDDGALLDPWPGGFFEEGFEERFL